MTKCPTKILESLPYFRFLHHPIKKKKGFLSRKKGTTTKGKRHSYMMLEPLQGEERREREIRSSAMSNVLSTSTRGKNKNTNSREREISCHLVE